MGPTVPTAVNEAGVEAPTEPLTRHTRAPPASPPPAAPRAALRIWASPVAWSLLLVLAGGAWLLDAAGAVDPDVGVPCWRWRWPWSAGPWWP